MNFSSPSFLFWCSESAQSSSVRHKTYLTYQSTWLTMMMCWVVCWFGLDVCGTVSPTVGVLCKCSYSHCWWCHTREPSWLGTEQEAACSTDPPPQSCFPRLYKYTVHIFMHVPSSHFPSFSPRITFFSFCAVWIWRSKESVACSCFFNIYLFFKWIKIKSALRNHQLDHRSTKRPMSQNYLFR